MPTVRRRPENIERMRSYQEEAPTRRPVQGRRPPRPGSIQRRARPVPDNEGGKSKPILLKIFLWIGLLLLFFVFGYIGVSWVMDFLSQKLFLKSGSNRIENQQDLSNFQESEMEKELRNNSSGEGVKQISLNLYHITNDSLVGTRRNFVARTQEDNIRDAIREILILSEVPNAENIKLLHVFRNAETAFLDISGQFINSLESIGQRRSLLLLTGIVRTMEENFSPISQIKFLIDSKLPNSRGIVDLSVAWKMPEKS